MSSATQPLITFATAWYEFGTSKFSNTQYYIWAGTLLQNARKFNLIVFVESEQMSKFICNLAKNNPRVIVIIHPFNDLPLCKTHGLQFEMNHQRNHLLNQRVSWKLVLLWCSKQYFVEFVENKCINDGTATQYYGWCDIGYFRSREGRSELMPDEISANQSLSNAIDTGGPIGSNAYFGQYEDFIDYLSGYGTITIEFLNSQNKERTNRAILLKEAFPAAISQMSIAADGTAYPTFNVTFKFNTYLYL